MRLLKDLHFGLRMLFKRPGFAVIAIGTLALGIGANTAIFSIVNTSLLNPIPNPEPEEILIYWETHPAFPSMSIAYPNYLDWREQASSFEELAVYRRDRFNHTGSGLPEQVRATMVSHNIFAALGVEPLLGRMITEAEDQPGGEAVAVLTYGYWQRRFAGDPAIVGERITLDGESYEVVGVMPAEQIRPTRSDLYVPIGRFSDNEAWQSRGNHPGIYGIARLAEGVSLAEAQDEMDAISRRLAESYPESNAENGVELHIYQEWVVSDVRGALYLLSAAVTLVLLIACVNIANLLMARNAVREREFALRTAIGASRRRMAGQMLTESLLLAALGGATGLLVAQFVIEVVQLWFAAELPRVDAIRLDAQVLAITAGLTLLTGVVFGILPALQGMRTAPTISMQSQMRAGDGPGQQRLNHGLVVTEIALAITLLVGAGLLLRSFASVLEVDPGFEPYGVVTAEVTVPQTRFADEAELIIFWERLVEEVETLPGVDGAAVANNLPFIGGYQTSFDIVGRPESTVGGSSHAEYAQVSPSYFEVLGMRLQRGRLFGPGDRDGSRAVAVIDAGFAEEFWPDEDPLGQQIESDETTYTIVGVVETVRHNGLEVEPPRPQMYFPLAQEPAHLMTLTIRSDLDAAALTGPIRQAVLAVNPDQPVGRIRTYGTIIDETLAGRRLTMTLLGIFAAVATALALIGIYGVISYGVTRRTREFGIRMAMGAMTRELLALVLRQVATVAAVGIAVGVVAAILLARAIEGQLFGVSALDPVTFLVVPAVVLVCALGACLMPAVRAGRVDPMEALRQE